MIELHEALADLAAIRRQIAQVEQFRGYHTLPAAIGALLAGAAGALQPWIVPEPTQDLLRYVALWVAVAIVAGSVSVFDVWQRHRNCDTLRGTLARLACEQFAPCVIAGAALTWTIVRFVPHVGWMLPGLWAILFSLGLFASCRLLPRAIIVVAGWYLLAGCFYLALGSSHTGLEPWRMPVIFGIGQAGAAVVLARQATGERARAS
ncbi:MAG TPA: hypothetical protein VHZ24_09940 [Pirellulales bacterium]|nr:hypothetical protein [Pirellulales bacterium]